MPPIDGAHIGYNIMPLKAYFQFSTSSLKLPIGGASYYVSRPCQFVNIILKFCLPTFWQNFENGQNAKILVLVMRPFKLFSSKTAEQISWILRTNSP